MGRRRLQAVAVALCILAAAGIVVLVVADGFLAEVNLIYTAVALLVFGIVAAVGISVIGTYPLAWLGWLCIVTAVVGFGITMGALWSMGEYGDDSPGLTKAAGSLFLFSFAIADAVLVLTGLRGDDSRAVRGLVVFTLLAVVALATMLTVAVVGETGGETYFRIAAIVAVLWTLGTALAPTLRAAQRA